MKSTELKIGNIIKIKKPILKYLIDEGFQKIYTDRTTVIYVGYDYLGVIIDNSEVEIMLQDVEPIPLTEEWLLRFGFDNNWKYIGDNKIEINIKEKEFWLGGDDACIWGHGFYGKIEYVHQLQNLYFCLFGEELTIKQK